jgi:hypothetical protein
MGLAKRGAGCAAAAIGRVRSVKWVFFAMFLIFVLKSAIDIPSIVLIQLCLPKSAGSKPRWFADPTNFSAPSPS